MRIWLKNCEVDRVGSCKEILVESCKEFDLELRVFVELGVVGRFGEM